MKRLILVSVLLMLVIPLSGFTGVRVNQNVTLLAAVMTGSQEVPGPGDPDGFGSAFFQVYEAKSQICYVITVAKILLPATAAHIHPGAKGVAGPPVVPLNAPNKRGISYGCATVDAAVLDAILSSPSDYYVNVHNADFPPGAVRGQLYLLPNKH